MPLVSVLMPVFNAAPYVEAAVASVLAQTLADLELLIVDDGSTDASLSILRGLAARDDRIRLSSRPNAGIVASLNELLAHARADVIARMDADDVCRPHRLERQKAYLDGHPSCVAVGSRSLWVDPEGLPLFEFMDRYTHEDIERSLLMPEIGILHPTVMMRRSAVEGAGGYRADYPHVEDLDLFLRLGEIGRLANLPEVLLDYRVHLSSVSHRHAALQWESGRRAVADACRRRGIDVPVAPLAMASPAGETPVQLYRKWAWWALGAGNLRTATKYAVRAALREPFGSASWNLLGSLGRDLLLHRR